MRRQKLLDGLRLASGFALGGLLFFLMFMLATRQPFPTWFGPVVWGLLAVTVLINVVRLFRRSERP